MNFDRHLIHRCTLVHTGIKTGEDDYGRDILEDVRYEGTPCRLDQLRERVGSGDTGSDYIISNMLFLSAKTDVRLDSRFEDIQDKDGNPLIAGSFLVETLNPIYARGRLHHYEVTLKTG
jgi:hypothetical protein